MKNNLFKKRTLNLFQIMDLLKLDIVLISDLSNIRYFTGFTGTQAFLLIKNQNLYLFTDGIYINQSKNEVKNAKIIRLKKNNILFITDNIFRLGKIQSLAFETKSINCQQYLELSKQIPNIKLLNNEITQIRAIKTQNEIESIEYAAQLSSKAFKKIHNFIMPGISEKDLSLELEYQMKKLGSERESFTTIVASGYNSSFPHIKPGSRKLKYGDLVIFDYGSVYLGYHSDETNTISIKNFSTKQKKIFDITKKAHDLALSIVKDGITCKKLDLIVRSYIKSQKLILYYPHALGHGVGLDVHEYPTIYFTSNEILKSGMVITIEPGVYIPNEFGIRIESLILIKKNGYKLLSPKKTNLLVY